MSKIVKSLSLQLGIAIMALAAPIFILALGIFVLQSRYLIHEESVECAQSILNTTVQRVRSYIGTIETAADANAWLLEKDFRPDSILSITDRIVRLNPTVVGCSVSTEPDMFPQYGHHFSVYAKHESKRPDTSIEEEDSVKTFIETDYDYFDRSWYKTPAKSGEACWVDPYSEFTETTMDHGHAIAHYCRPLKGKDGRVIGVVNTELSFSRLAEIINSVEHPYPNAYFILLGKDGRYLIHPDSTRLYKKTIFTDTDPKENADKIAVGHEMTAGNQGVISVYRKGERNHVCYQPVPGTDWSMALMCPDSDVTGGLHMMTYIIIALIIIGLAVILWITRRIVMQAVSPLRKLMSKTKEITEGHYDEIIPYTLRKDPIGEMQNTFAHMHESLSERMKKLIKQEKETQRHNEELKRAMKEAETATEEKDTYIKNVTQQMRMPLNAITGFADMLGESSKNEIQIPEEEMANITSIMKENANKLNRMALMLLDNSGSSAAEELHCQRTDEVSCNEVARECIQHTHTHFPNVVIHFKSDLADSFCILTNYLYLMRTLREPLYNAARYSDGQNITLHVTQTKDTILFTVTDTGPGLTQEQQEKVFKPFTKVGDLSQGLGLGLPLAKRHAFILGGDLVIDKSYHQGCHITLEMPK